MHMGKSKELFSTTMGFTLVEMLLVIAVIVVLFGITAPIYFSFQTRNDLDLAATTFVYVLRRAQTLAEGGESDAEWGVRTDPGRITLFRGSNFATRDQNFDEIFTFPQHIVASGNAEIIFMRITGIPVSPGIMVLTNASGALRTVSINVKGSVDY